MTPPTWDGRRGSTQDPTPATVEAWPDAFTDPISIAADGRSGNHARRAGCPCGCMARPGVVDDLACARHVRDHGAAYRLRVSAERRQQGRAA